MFIRRTQTRRAPDGKPYFSHRLVLTERLGNTVRQRTLLNLGRHFDIAQQHWPQLCARVSDVLSGQMRLLPAGPPAVEQEAQRIAAQLLARGAQAGGPAAAATDIQPLDVDSLHLVRPRSVGVEQVGLWALEQLRLPALLTRLGVNSALRAAALGTLVGRLAQPASERATHRSQVFAGNVSEPRTLAGMLEALEAPPGALVVMDRGVATEACVQWLREHGYRYLVVSRERHRQFDAAAAVSVQTQSNQTVQLHKVVSADRDEVRLYCYSQERAEKERAIVERFAGRFEAALTKLHDGLARPRTHKRLDQVWQRIGRLKAKHARVAAHYQIGVSADESGDKAVALTWTRRPQDGSLLTHPGVSCLRSSETDWDEDTLWRTYTTLSDVEAVFRSLKSELGLRPIYHRTPRRADGHLLLTVIAYQLVQLIRSRLRAHGEHASWTTLRRTLEGQQRVTATFRRPDGRTLHVRTATCAEPTQRAIYDALGVDPHPGGVRKTIV